jgi:hypothetical protein
LARHEKRAPPIRHHGESPSYCARVRPAFEGTPDRIGAADKLFAARISGFRFDFVWLIWSTIVIFVVGIRLAPELRQRPRARTDFLLCVAAVLGCLVYLARMLLTGMLYFG